MLPTFVEHHLQQTNPTFIEGLLSPILVTGLPGTETGVNHTGALFKKSFTISLSTSFVYPSSIWFVYPLFTVQRNQNFSLTCREVFPYSHSLWQRIRVSEATALICRYLSKPRANLFPVLSEGWLFPLQQNKKSCIQYLCLVSRFDPFYNKHGIFSHVHMLCGML